ncbi:MAG TPA: Wzz/FepE/Etk N-terminal domain-containing protein [Kribbellaceae bacterium]|nr:Wzz/FepE/Etk N-terminal domain-containing protein [Kribbellaceae bacterium]
MKATNIGQGRFEPTVFGAVRRYRIMVFVIALLTAATAAGYALVEPANYRAHATVTVPQTSLSQGEARDQYLDSQVLLLQSQEVAERAARIANAALNANVLSARDFSGEGKSLEITPPEGATPGSYGSSIVAVSFTWPSARVAQVGTNAVLQAFDDARGAAIIAQGEATVAGIEKAIRDARTRGQLVDLLNQRTQTLVNQQVDLARHPTVAWAAEPQVPVNGNSKRSGAIGLVIGTVLGAGLAYARASRNQSLEEPLDAAAIYDAPLIGEIPAPGTDRIVLNGSAAAGPLPMAADPRFPAEAYRFTARSIERIRAARGHRLALAFVSTETGAERSFVVANVALAVAESGTPVLAVDADSTDGAVTALLLPGSPPDDGFEQVLAGRRPLSDSIRPSPLNHGLYVLGAGPASAEETTGAAYARAVEKVIAEAKETFDLVLFDSPALVRVARATELVDVADAAIVVLGPGEPVRDHITMAERLDLVESEVVGYIYRRARRGPPFVHHVLDRFSSRAARRTDMPVVPSSPRSEHPGRENPRSPERQSGG